jgi:hypothetical protein
VKIVQSPQDLSQWTNSKHHTLDTMISDVSTQLLEGCFKKPGVLLNDETNAFSSPHQLDPMKSYVRIDEKVLRAYMMISHEQWNVDNCKMVHFKDMDGVLCAHLITKKAQLHCRTEHERMQFTQRLGKL